MKPAFANILSNPIEGEFEDTNKTIVPKEGEVRIVANKNKECQYYYEGLDQCRQKIARIGGDPSNKYHDYGFLPCKRLVDAHYRCLTDEKHGYTLEEAPEEAKVHANNFMDCAFKKLVPMVYCRRYFDEVLRTIYRSPNNQLQD
jgi:hypothetical protein